MPTEPAATGPRAGGTPPLEEARARALLGRAADTIDVDDVAPMSLTGLPEPWRPWRPVLAAAAAMVVLVGVGVVIGQQTNRPATEGSRPSDPTVLGQGEHVYGEEEMPSLIGYTEDDAVALLEQRGLDVRVRVEKVTCNVDGQVMHADPAPSTRIAPGDRATIWVTENRQVIDCLGEVDWRPVWQMVRFARGLGAPPEFADKVRLSVIRPDLDHRAGVAQSQEMEVRGSTLSDPDAWTMCARCPSVLDGIAEAVTDPSEWFGRSPRMVAEQSTRCLVAPTSGSGGPLPWRVHVWAEPPVDGVSCPRSSFLIGRDDRGRINDVTYVAPPMPAGEDDSGTAVDPTRAESAEAFVDWARREGPAPYFADRVRFLVDGEVPPGSRTWLTEPERRTSWNGCAGSAILSCHLSPIGLLNDRRGRGQVVVTKGRAPCRKPGSLPAELQAAVDPDVVALSVPEPRTCAEDLGTELWIDEAGAIRALNLTTLPSR